jgi:molybdenum cofactor cytidylyltransferase
MINVIVLAAGMSRRMGAQNKLLLPFGNSTILETTIHNIMDAGIGKMTIVLGHEADIIRQNLKKFEKLSNLDTPLSICENLNYEKGMTTSIQAGIKATEIRNPKSEIGYMICLSDMPLITTEEYTYLANQFADFYRKDKRAIVQPTYQGQRGNPTIFSKTYKDDILNLNHLDGCKPIVQAHQNHLYFVEMPTPSVLRDADTPEAYQMLFV